MKKISIVLAILAVFLVFSCSNAAGAVDVAGNPVDLAGSWSGSVAYKSGIVANDPPTHVAYVDGKDYTGTWVLKGTVGNNSKDYDKVDGTTTYKYIFRKSVETKTSTRVVSSDGGYVQTDVTKTEYPKFDTLVVPANVEYHVSTDAGNRTYYEGFTIPAILAGTVTTTTTKTVKVTKESNGLYTEAVTTVTENKYEGDKYTNGQKTYTTETYDTTENNIRNVSSLSFLTNLVYTDYTFVEDTHYKQTVGKTKKIADGYYNDISEKLTFVVLADGTFTLTSEQVETQAEAAAVAETDDYYAVPARKAATKTTTTTTTGTVAAWEVPATADTAAKTMMALSSKAETSDIVGTENFKNLTAKTVKAIDSGTFEIRIIKGTKDKDVAAKTRLYVSGTNIDDCVVILDKAEAAK